MKKNRKFPADQRPTSVFHSTAFLSDAGRKTCMKATQVYKEESERDAEQEKHGNQPRHNEVLAPTTGTMSVTWTPDQRESRRLQHTTAPDSVEKLDKGFK